MSMAIVIVGSSYPNILSLIYESADTGCPIYVIRYQRYFGGGRECYTAMRPERLSRFISKYHFIKGYDDTIDWQKVKSAIDDSIGEEKYDRVVVLPTDDAFCLLLNDHKKEFPDNFVFNGSGINGRGDISELALKGRQKELAKSVGIDVALGGVVHLYDNECAYKGPFPCLVKINKSTECYTATKGLIGKCQDEKELQGALNLAKALGLKEVVVEEFLPIEYECCLTGASNAGKVVAMGGYREMMMCTGARTGNAITGYVIDIDADGTLSLLSKKIQKLIQAVGYNGYFHVDIAYANSRYYLIEINLRLGAMSFSVGVAGANIVGAYLNALSKAGEERLLKPHDFGAYVLNERALLEELGDCRISLHTYFKLLLTYKVRKIKCKNDVVPYLYFSTLSVIPIFISLLNMVIPLKLQKRMFAFLKRGMKMHPATKQCQ